MEIIIQRDYEQMGGGYGADELSRAGAFRVYADPLELHRSLDELGVLP